MFIARSVFAGLTIASSLLSATFGTAVPLVGGATDIVLDEARRQLYLVNSTQGRVEVYSIAQRRFLTPIPTDSTPISAALSRSGRMLYVTSYDASALNIIDLDADQVVNRVTLPAKPEGVAVGNDERVLISTIGSGTGNLSNVLLLYDPNAQNSNPIMNIAVTPPPPMPPQLPPPSGRTFLQSRGQLRASTDGSVIVGANVPSPGNTRTVFVFEVASATVLRSRNITNASSVLSIAPDNSKFMSGVNLFDTESLQILAQQNLANSAYPINPGTNFNLQTNQGGSVFAPDGSVLYSAFDISPIQNPAARANISQLMLSDPDNLLISLGLQMPENLSGKMLISSDGGTIYALSESGFMTIPISTMNQFPIAVPATDVTLLATDQCGVTAGQNTSRVAIRNAGRGQMTVSAQLLQYPPTGAGGLGGFGGPGGGNVGGGIIIIVPGIPNAPGTTPGPVVPGGGGQQNANITASAPVVRNAQTADGPALDFTFNAVAARALGTISPSHDFLIQSPQAINIPQRVRVYQNYRNAEARGQLMPVTVGISANEALEDLLYDSNRQRLYIANSGLNRIEVFDIRQKQFMQPIKVGQLPRSMALSPDGNTLWVVGTGGESISIVDPDKMQATGRVKFPPIPLNASSALVTPAVIAASQRGPMFVTSGGQIWRVVGNDAVPRGASAVIGTTAQGAPTALTAPFSIANTPNGEYVLVVSGNGFAYLYDPSVDDFVQGRQIFTGNQQGYYGPIAAGMRGSYFAVNGTLLNQALTPVASVTAPSTISAVASAGNTYARYVAPARANANALPADAGNIEMVDATTGVAMRSVPALEGPMTQVTGTTRATISGRTMAIDSTGTTAYMISTSGLSILPLDAPAGSRPQVFSKGAVNLGSYQTQVSQNGWLSIFGANLASSAQSGSSPLPTMLGGTCVTLSNTPMPLYMTSSGQINALVPMETKPGSYQLVVRSIDRKMAATAQRVAVSKYAPAVLTDPASGQILLFHKDGRAVSKSEPAKRDEPLTMYAVSLGPTTGGAVSAGNASPSSPLAVTDKVQVFFGDPTIKEAGIIVDWSGLAPGFVGLYQLNLRVPGDHLRGDALPVTLRIGSVNSPNSGPVTPTVAVD